MVFELAWKESRDQRVKLWNSVRKSRVWDQLDAVRIAPCAFYLLAPVTNSLPWFGSYVKRSPPPRFIINISVDENVNSTSVKYVDSSRRAEARMVNTDLKV
jgi:hypothetical protein